MSSKGYKTVGFILLMAIITVIALQLPSQQTKPLAQRTPSNPASIPAQASVAVAEITPVCLSADNELRPPWECYEVKVSPQPRQYHRYEVRHSDGTTHRVLSFKQNGHEWIRFVPDRTGSWCVYHEAGTDKIQCLTINSARPDYAKGFVKADKTPNSEQAYWQRSATSERFVPQFVMFDQPDIEDGIQRLLKDHGFTGFHITNLRDFLNDPGYFESIITRTYRAGGVTYFWVWGDRQRRQTPDTYGVNTDLLYNEICARLMPLPGWMVGYGFDNFEWVKPAELKDWHQHWHECTSYPHLMGARGYSNRYEPIWPGLDFASWEWHRPALQDYRNHLTQAGGKPAFSGDRFRIRSPSKYPEKDYDEVMTYQGLWNSLFAGGVGNIWGKMDSGGAYSQSYDQKSRIKLYADFVRAHLKPDSETITVPGYAGCLQSSAALICLAWQTDTVPIPVQQVRERAIAQAMGVNIRQSLEPVTLTAPPHNDRILKLPKHSDWVVIFPRLQAGP